MGHGTGNRENGKENDEKNRDSNMKQKNEKNNLKEIKEYGYFEILIFVIIFLFACSSKESMKIKKSFDFNCQNDRICMSKR